jgi:flagellar biosynthesis chaperone FliJ
MDNIKKLQARLNKVEKELDTCRTSVLQDGWQTQRFAKKSRKWDVLAQRKMQLIQAIEDMKEVRIIPDEFGAL